MNKQGAIKKLGRMNKLQAYMFLLRRGLGTEQAKQLAMKYGKE